MQRHAQRASGRAVPRSYPRVPVCQLESTQRARPAGEPATVECALPTLLGPPAGSPLHPLSRRVRPGQRQQQEESVLHPNTSYSKRRSAQPTRLSQGAPPSPSLRRRQPVSFAAQASSTARSAAAAAGCRRSPRRRRTFRSRCRHPGHRGCLRGRRSYEAPPWTSRQRTHPSAEDATDRYRSPLVANVHMRSVDSAADEDYDEISAGQNVALHRAATSARNMPPPYALPLGANAPPQPNGHLRRSILLDRDDASSFTDDDAVSPLTHVECAAPIRSRGFHLCHSVLAHLVWLHAHLCGVCYPCL